VYGKLLCWEDVFKWLPKVYYFKIVKPKYCGFWPEEIFTPKISFHIHNNFPKEIMLFLFMGWYGSLLNTGTKMKIN